MTYGAYKPQIGEKIGKLTILEIKSGGKVNGKVIPKSALCVCDCGIVKKINYSRLTGKIIKSCGCLLGNPKHKQTGTSEYRSWSHMKERCYNPKCRDYKNYGARGITVCNRWLNSYQNFIDDMGLKPDKKYSIDRIDTNGNYQPSNCRWASSKQQNNNRRKAIPKKKLGSIFNCVRCEKQFYVYPCRLLIAKYCSRKCHYDH